MWENIVTDRLDSRQVREAQSGLNHTDVIFHRPSPGKSTGQGLSQLVLGQEGDVATKERDVAVRREGLAFKRHFSKEGVHPFDEVEWEVRDAVIPNFKEGGNAFEQREVEFPKPWSQNATNIVAQKYFRGPLGTPQRESSVRQMVGRVVDTITGWGLKEGYFASDADARTFSDELTHLLVKQKAAFNSPVWFNVGVEESPQSSACFILSIDDTMRSILNWYGEEGIIFKGGSGSGINLSPLRSSKEQLAGGGLASGPVSFMRGADASAGTIKSGGKTRRAAKMVVLNVDHPDVRDFIWCKAVEERKARVLRDAGFDMDVDGKDAYSMQYQNANNSVRVTDEFMRAYLDDRDWKLKAVVSEKTLETVRARDLMREIAQAAWECADPGMQYDTTTNDWHTCPASGRINASNPCSEYVHLDNSACNLASLNLLKFLNADGTFDIPSFKQAVEIVFTAQEIIVGNSSYPTEKIERNAKAFRQLGLGYANLGALLMARGLPYDSEGGRAWAAVITALMTGHAYRTSTKVAEVMGPFAGYAPNRDAMLRVVRKHRAAADEIDAELVPEGLLQAAKTAWDEAIALGEEHGYRNAQATVLAPTGTISFLLDCDTTGIEPDLALVKTKKLVGGGSMQIVNQTVPRALRRLGYGEDQVQGVVAYISEHNTVVGAPMLKEEHYPVFDCSMGERAIHYTGHVKMMAAAQPFISGAISKTVNMPEQATVEEVEQMFVDGWKLGLKAIAIYRDNCKVAQPLSAERKRAPGAKVGEPTVELPGQPIRRRLPARRPAKTFSFAVGEAEGYITAGEYESDGVGEVFLKVAKQGSTLSGVMDAFAIAVSIGLQYGVPLEAFVSKFVNMRFEPSGITNDPDIRFASSLVDYVFRRLALEYLTPEKRAGMGIQTVDERKEYANAQVNGESNGAEVAASSRGPEQARLIQLSDVPEAEAPSARELDAPLCYACGSKMQPAGSCYVCTSCGSTSGCS
jgi:ribonucleoside-diphosphate reductase alpha chain